MKKGSMKKGHGRFPDIGEVQARAPSAIVVGSKDAAERAMVFAMPDTANQMPPCVCELTILMPCLNEAETLGVCIAKARAFLARSGVPGEILIADNGSTDGSRDIAWAAGARVVTVDGKGYGRALLGGIQAARGRYIIMGDADDSYDFSDLDGFVTGLRGGFALVMGNRFKGGIKPDAMPALHRYFGNPVLSMIGRLFFRSPCCDFHCGLRGFDRDAILGLDLNAPGMEFASEMVVKATIRRLPITEVPTVLWPDGRSRAPHLRSWRDGWRHLRFLLLFSPRWLFLYPGLAALLLGLAGMAWHLPIPRGMGGVNTLFYASLAVVVGFHSVMFYGFARLYGIQQGLAPPDPRFSRLAKAVTLEMGLLIGLALLVLGIGLAAAAVSAWARTAFNGLGPDATMRLVIPSGTCILLAFQVGYGAFFLSVLELRAGKRPEA